MAEPVTEATIDRAMTVLRTLGVPPSALAAGETGEDREILRRILAAEPSGTAP